MSFSLNSIADRFDQFVSSYYLLFTRERNALITYLVHGLFKDRSQINLNHVRPQQGITIDIFRQFIEYHLRNGYCFISPEDILNGLSADKKYVLLTFDDGYFNNILSLELLHEYNIPAVFFISTGFIERNHCFWWDAIYRERLRRNSSSQAIRDEISQLKKVKYEVIEHYILDNFGEKALEPLSDIDRPFTPAELRSFAMDPLVHLGNHTANHAILTNYSPQEIRAEIIQGQSSINKIAGITPVIISYPNGNYNEEALSASIDTGLKLGITTYPRKNYLPMNLNGFNPFLIGRFTFSGNKDLRKQCDYYRSDFKIREVLQGSKVKSNEAHDPQIPSN